MHLQLLHRSLYIQEIWFALKRSMLTVHFMIVPKFVYSSGCYSLTLTDCLVEEWHSVSCSSKRFSRLLRVLLKKNGKDETPKFQNKWSQGAGVATCHSQELIPSLNSPQTCSFLFYNIHCSSFALNPFLLTLHLEMLLQTSVPFLHWEHLQWGTASLLSEVFEVFTGSL